MLAFLAEHTIAVFFGLISAGLLAVCKYFYSKNKQYKALIDEKEKEQIEGLISAKTEPIIEEIEELRAYSRKVDATEKEHIRLIVSSYRFRLIQLCREYLKQGYLTEDQYEQLSEFYKVYEGLGGNGQAKDFYERTIKLPPNPPSGK